MRIQLSLFALGTAFALTAPAFAQQGAGFRGRRPASAAPAPAPSTPAPAATPAAPVADTPAVTEARERQRRGRALLDAHDPNGALAEFQRVYELLEGHPRRYMALSNIGRCYQMLGQYDRAMEYYQRYLREGGEAGEDRATVAASITALDDLLGTLEVTVAGPAQAEVWADNRVLGTAPGSVRIPGGHHVIELRAPGFLPSRQQVDLSAHDTRALRFTLERPGPGLPSAVFWTGFTLTAAVGLTGAVLGTITLLQRADIDSRLQSSDPAVRFLVTGEPADRAALANLALAADVCFGVAGALGIATAITAFFTDWRSGHPAATPRTAWLITPLPSSGHVGLGLSGTF